MPIVFKYAWILFVIVTCANALSYKYKSKKYIAENPDLKEGYDTIFKNFILYGNIPWLIIGMGCLTGSTSSLFDAFNPRALNPFVLAFHGSIVLIWILLVRFIYFKGGAEFLEKHPGLLRKNSFSGNPNVTAAQIKWFFPIALLGGIIGMAMMWSINFPVPKF
jgi:hypothetical protein